MEFIGALHRSPGYVTAAEPPSNQNLIKRFKIQNDLKRGIMRSFGTNISNIKCAEAEFCAHIIISFEKKKGIYTFSSKMIANVKVQIVGNEFEKIIIEQLGA